MAKSVAVEKAASDTPLKQEYETYLQQLNKLARDEGRYVLIHHADVAGVYDTYNAALTAGYEKFGVNKPFLVKLITTIDTPIIIR